MNNTLSRFTRNLRILPRWMIVLIDLSFIGFSAMTGYLLRFNFSLTDMEAYGPWQGSFLTMGCGLLAILITSSYKGIIRYTGIQDGVRIFFMLILTALLVCGINLVYHYNPQANLVPYSVLLIGFLSSFLFLFNYRLLVKYIFSSYRSVLINRSRVMIFGAGRTGMMTRHVVESTPRMKVVGFLEDDMNKAGKLLDGVKIFSANNDDLQLLLSDLQVDDLVITAKDISLSRKNELVDVCLKQKVKIRTVPPVEKWVRGELSISQIKEINIEELLGRESIRIVNPAIDQEIRGRRVCITGAAGSIGSELLRQLLSYKPELVVLIDQAESALHEVEREVRARESGVRVFPYLADITNKDRISSIFGDHKPEIVFHAAAYKHVPMMEGNPSEAITCNILGTRILADVSVTHGVRKFVMVSTDKAVNPTNVMGCSKRIAEIYVQALGNDLQRKGRRTAFVTTRFGNVLGSNGSVIPTFKKQIQSGGPITVTHPEITRYFMTIPEASQLVLEAAIMGKGGEIFIFDMGQSVKILDLARKMIQLSGLEPDRDIEIVFTGLREGEKLYEELLNNKEDTIPTHHDKILIAKVQEYDYPEISSYVGLFEDLVNDRNELKMVALMKELVPEYKSNYSRFEVLDKQSGE